MPLKTLVKVGNISNLSDARYCAGMGVDMLGFVVVPGQAAYMAPTLYREIRGWISGPQAVAALQGLPEAAALGEIIDTYQPDYLEVSTNELAMVPAAVEIRLIVALEPGDDLAALKLLKERIAYVQVKEKDTDLIQAAAANFPVLVEVQSETTLETTLTTQGVQGLVLSGSQEIRPGFKDYSDLAEVLEQLEVD